MATKSKQRGSVSPPSSDGGSAAILSTGSVVFHKTTQQGSVSPLSSDSGSAVNHPTGSAGSNTPAPPALPSPAVQKQKSVASGVAASSSSKSSLPSVAGAPGTSKSFGGHKDVLSAKASKAKSPNAKGNGKPKNPIGRGSPPRNKGAALGQCKQDANIYNMTKLYVDAVGKGFATQAALNTFNAWVKANQDNLDPAHQVFCNWCGNVSFEVCACALGQQGQVVVTQDALVIPTGPAKIELHYTRFGRAWRWLMRGYRKSEFDPVTINNHHINELEAPGRALGVQLKTDEYIIPELYNYIKLGQNVSYKLAGVDDRAARLAHSHKLALRWMDEVKVPLVDRTDSKFVTCVMVTVQKACDQKESSMLYQSADPSFRRASFFGWIRNKVLFKDKDPSF